MLGPFGKGLYLRDDALYGGAAQVVAYLSALRAKWCTVNLADPSHAATAAALRAHGVPFWLFLSPGEWLPRRAVETCRRMTRAAVELGARGFVADVEDADDWRAIPNGERASLLVELRRELVAASYVCDVGVTSFPSHSFVAKLASGRLWGSPQVYERSSDGVLPAHWCARWLSDGWGLVVPSVAGWDRSAAEQREYLRLIPAAQGAAIWTAAPPRQGSDVFDELRTWEPSPPASLAELLSAIARLILPGSVMP